MPFPNSTWNTEDIPFYNWDVCSDFWFCQTSSLEFHQSFNLNTLAISEKNIDAPKYVIWQLAYTKYFLIYCKIPLNILWSLLLNSLINSTNIRYLDRHNIFGFSLVSNSSCPKSVNLISLTAPKILHIRFLIICMCTVFFDLVHHPLNICWIFT